MGSHPTACFLCGGGQGPFSPVQQRRTGEVGLACFGCTWSDIHNHRYLLQLAPEPYTQEFAKAWFKYLYRHHKKSEWFRSMFALYSEDRDHG